MLADLAIGDRLVRKADGGRRPKAIREIPVEGGRGVVFTPDGRKLICGGNGRIFIHDSGRVNAKDKEGRTPLDLAKKRADKGIIELLGKHGAKESPTTRP